MASWESVPQQYHQEKTAAEDGGERRMAHPAGMLYADPE